MTCGNMPSVETAYPPLQVPPEADATYRTHSTMFSRDGIVQGKEEQAQDAYAEWQPGKQEYATMVTIAVVSLMVALDATI